MTLRPGLGEIAAASLVRCQAPYSGRANCSPMTQIRLCRFQGRCRPHQSAGSPPGLVDVRLE